MFRESTSCLQSCQSRINQTLILEAEIENLSTISSCKYLNNQKIQACLQVYYKGCNNIKLVNYQLIIIKVEMDLQTCKHILDPYKTIGSFVHGPVSVSKTEPFSIAAACYNSFKIYSDKLAIKMVSGVFSQPIKAIHIHNEFTYVVTGTQVIKIKYHHIVKKWQLSQYIPTSSKSKNRSNVSMLVFEEIIIIGLGTTLFMLPQTKRQNYSHKNGQIQSMKLGLEIIEIVHPVTYINKVLVYSSDRILLVNPISQKILFDYANITKQILNQDKQINIVSPTPLVDIVAVCLSSGEIVIVNIRTSKIVFTMKQKKSVSAIAFSQTESLMTSGDQTGNIILWDLENKKILYRLQAAFSHPVSNLFFVPGYPLLTATSSVENSVKQFRINLQDSKSLLKFRQRTGCSSLNNLISIKCQNNKQITFNTKSQTLFTSLYSHCNMYSLPFCLDSSLPYHLTSRNFCIQVYRQRSVIGKLNIRQNTEIGKFSVSKKFVIIGTKSRLIKVAIPSGSNPSTLLHIALEWKISDPLQIMIHKEHHIFVFCSDSIYVLNFNEAIIIATINEGENCFNPVSNSNQTMIALQNRTKQNIQIWDMRSISLCRQFLKTKNQSNCTKLSFTSDNRYLLAAHVDHSVQIWSILQSSLYKTIQLQAAILDMCFTPDNAYFLSIFQNSKQVKIWHNYIGKITTNQNQNEMYKFQTKLNTMGDDYRSKLNSQTQAFNNQILNGQQQLDDLLDQIQDSSDLNTQNYDFISVSKWMSLVYYDQIKNRNSINKNEQVPSLPFFLDFKNLSQQQAKIKNQMRQEVKDKKNKQKQKIDAQLSQDLHQIKLTDKSSKKDYEQTWRMLSQLSVAETDYQLRRFLILPKNCEQLLKMFLYIVDRNQNPRDNLMLINVVITRAFEIIGSQLCSQNLKELGKSLLEKTQQIISSQQDIVQRCISVANQNH